MKLKHISTAPKDGSTIKVSDGRSDYNAFWSDDKNSWQGIAKGFETHHFTLLGIENWYEDAQ